MGVNLKKLADKSGSYDTDTQELGFKKNLINLYLLENFLLLQSLVPLNRYVTETNTSVVC